VRRKTGLLMPAVCQMSLLLIWRKGGSVVRSWCVHCAVYSLVVFGVFAFQTV
jgi:hypothetical protein